MRSQNNRSFRTAPKSALLPALKPAFLQTLPVFAGFMVLGIVYGILMDSRGYGPGTTFLMSAVCFCGSMQFAAIPLLTSSFNPLGAFLLSLMVNARHMLYGISMLGKYKGIGKIKFFLIYTLCDETYSIVSTVEPPEGVDKKYFYAIISGLDWLYWVTGSVIGTVAGGLINFNTAGLDFALSALFVVLFLEAWKKRENRINGVIGIAATSLCLFIFGRDNFIIPSMILILFALIIGMTAGKEHVE